MRYIILSLLFSLHYSAIGQKAIPILREQPSVIKNQPGIISTTLSQAQSVGADKLWLDGYEGTGLYAGMWEAGSNSEVSTSNTNLIGRVTIMKSNSESSHATNVALTLASDGTSGNSGVAPGAHILSYNLTGSIFTEMSAAAFTSTPMGTQILVSNHSYAYTAGWGSQITYNNNCNPKNDGWWGVEEISTTEDYKFGNYGGTAQGQYDEDYDEVANTKKYLTIVKPAGNDKGSNEGLTPTYDRYSYASNTWPVSCALTSPVPEDDGGADGYDCIPIGSLGKNVLTIGACNNISLGNYPPTTNDINLVSSSGWGPADDGRIKPDLVAPGVLTSYSTPVVSGAVLLLQEAYEDKYSGEYMKSSTVRGLLCHTAFEAGTSPGPDYQHGWGMMSAENAYNVIKNSDVKNGTNFIVEDQLTNGSESSFYFYAPANNTEAKISLSWTDPEKTPAALTYTPADLNNRAASLIHDLDLRLIRICDNQEYFPYKLDPNAPALAATRADNTVDNLELIHETTLQQGWYLVKVNHKGTIATQEFSLISTGLTIPYVYTGSMWGSSGTLPSSGDVVVLEENYTAPTTLSVGPMLIAENITLTVPTSGTFTIDGDWTAMNNSSVSGEGKIELNGNTSAFCGTLNLPNLDFNKTGGQSLTVNSNASLNVSNLLDLKSGTLITNNALTMIAQSNSNREGYAQIMDNGGNISGNVNYQAYILGNSDWRHLSSPVTTTLNDFLEDFEFYYLGADASVKNWDAATSSWLNNAQVNDVISETTPVALFFGTSNATGSSQVFTNIPHLIELSGAIHTGNIIQPLTYHDPGIVPGFIGDPDGWNLVSNPYPTGLDWNLVKSALPAEANSYYYLYDANHSTPAYYSDDGSHPNGMGDLNGIIAPFQAFWVKLENPPGGSFTLTNNMRTTSKSKIYKTEPQRLVLEISAFNKPNDLLELRFTEEATNIYDPCCDAFKIADYTVKNTLFYSLTNNKLKKSKMAINSLSIPHYFAEVPIGYYSTETRNKISINKNNLSEDWKVLLHDQKLNVTCDLRKQAYTFNTNAGIIDDRFKVFIGPNVSIEDLTSTKEPWVHQDKNNVVVSNLYKNDKYEVTIYNLSGQVLYKTQGYFNEQIRIDKTHFKNTKFIIIHTKAIEVTFIKKVLLN